MQGGMRNTVWDFSNDGPSGRIPICTAGHTKLITCQVSQHISRVLVAFGLTACHRLAFQSHVFSSPHSPNWKYTGKGISSWQIGLFTGSRAQRNILSSLSPACLHTHPKSHSLDHAKVANAGDASFGRLP